MHKKLFVAFTVILALLLLVTPAFAVQFGEPDGDGHPHVGLMVFDVGGRPSHRCSGTLLTSTVMLTAGHCTFGTSGGRVWFDADVGAGRPGNGYPFAGGTGIEFCETHTHPNYIDPQFFLFDVGVAILCDPVVLDTYGVLPPLGLFEQLATQRGLQEQNFTIVGYGLQSVVPSLSADLVRFRGTVQMIDPTGLVPGIAVTFTDSPGQGHGSGGTCFGDSGGPIFHGDSNVVAAVNSFVLNSNCMGVAGGYRVDTTDDQDFINGFLP